MANVQGGQIWQYAGKLVEVHSDKGLQHALPAGHLDRKARKVQVARPGRIATRVRALYPIDGQYETVVYLRTADFDLLEKL